MADYVHVGRNYGLRYMSLEEEFNLPKNMKQTRNNKVQIINDCDDITQAIDTLRYRAFMCPELDDEAHAKLVDEYAALIRAVREKTNEALRFGYY